jgi:hypothetical protein
MTKTTIPTNAAGGDWVAFLPTGLTDAQKRALDTMGVLGVFTAQDESDPDFIALDYLQERGFVDYALRSRSDGLVAVDTYLHHRAGAAVARELPADRRGSGRRGARCRARGARGGGRRRVTRT